MSSTIVVLVINSHETGGGDLTLVIPTGADHQTLLSMVNNQSGNAGK